MHFFSLFVNPFSFSLILHVFPFLNFSIFLFIFTFLHHFLFVSKFHFLLCSIFSFPPLTFFWPLSRYPSPLPPPLSLFGPKTCLWSMHAGPCAHCSAVCPEQERMLNAGACAQCKAACLMQFNANRVLNAKLVLNAGAVCFMPGPCAQCKAVYAGPCVQCRVACSMIGRVLKAMPRALHAGSTRALH